MLTCVNCSREIIPIKGFNWLVFIILLFAFFPLVLIQLIAFSAKTAQKCPLCKKNVYTGG